MCSSDLTALSADGSAESAVELWAPTQNPGSGQALVASTFNIPSRAIAFGAGSLWVIGDRDAILRLDPALGRVQARIAGPSGARGIAFGEGSLWVTSSGTPPTTLQQIDPSSNRVVSSTPLRGAAPKQQNYPFAVVADPRSIAIGFGSVWVCDPGDDEVWRITPKP